MAAGTSLPETSQARRSDSDRFGTQVIEYDRYIEKQLYRTRRQVKGVDIASSLMLLAVASLAYLMLVALIDHWAVTGGLGFTGRVVALGLLAAGVLVFTVLRIVPLILRRINPVYAAYTIERNRPGIKNGLINFLLLRSESQRLPERIYEAMEAQAANALSATHAEVAVDRTPVIRLLLTMVAVLVCVSLYAVLSPKNPFTSFRRVMSPWSDVAPPTRVAIEDIQPGEGQGFHDQHVVVSAFVAGLRSGEEAIVHYSTVDGQVVDKPVPMTLAENSYRHAAELPPDNLGLQQDLEYWLTAGDAISRHYHIKVDTAPTIVVEEIEYTYPKYAELAPRKVARHGDIQALTGTRVTLRAKANQMISQANLDFECDGRNDLDMKVDGTRAEVSFPLVWNDKTRKPEHESYQLRFRNQDGHENPKPVRYTIEVIPDLNPEVELVEPQLDLTKDLVAPAGKSVRFTVEAADPDFKLASVKFLARRRGTPLVEESLLAESRAGEFHRDYLLDLKQLAIAPGEQIEFWAAADDNREPKANHTETPHYRLRIATPDDKGQGNDDQNAAKQDENRDAKGGNSGKKQQRGQRNDQDQQGNEGEAGDQKAKEKQGGGKSNEGGKQNQHEKQPGQESGDEKSPSGGQSNQQDSGEGSQSGNPGDKKSSKGSSEPGEGGEGQQKKDGSKGAGDKSDENKRLDPERDAGKAIDEINKHFNQKEKQGNQQKQDQPKQEGQQSPEEAGGKTDKNQNGQKQTDSKEEQGKSSLGGEPADKPQQNDKTEKNDKSQQKQGSGSNEKQPSSHEGGASGGKDDANQQSGGSEKQPSDKQSPGKQQAGKKPSDQSNKGGQGKHQAGSKDQSGQEQKPGEKPDEQGPQGDKKRDQQPSQGERGGGNQGDDSSGDKSQGEKPAGKSGKQQSSDEKGAKGSQQGTANEGGDKTQKDNTGGGKEGDAIEGDEQEKHADGETKPREGQGGQAQGAGEPDEKMKKHEGESPDQKGGDPKSKDKGEGGAGNSEGSNKHGSPTTSGGNQGRKKKELSPDNKKGTSEDEPESSSQDKRQSDSQGAEQGENDGGGKGGGGQRANNEGTGAAGQNSEADQGGGQAETKGKGPTGTKGGDQQKADKPSGGKPSGEKGPGSNEGKGDKSDRGIKANSPETADPRGHNNNSQEAGEPQGERQPPNEKQPASQNNRQKKQAQGSPQASSPDEGHGGEAKPSDRGGHDLRGGNQRGNPTTGGQPGPDETVPPEQTDNSEPGGDEANQEYARKATDLALDRLKDQLAKDKPDPELLDKLQWTKEDIERFVQQWNRLKKSADESGPKGDAARQELDDALRSLGLSPRSTSLSGGQKRDDGQRNLREGRRAAPPPEYEEQWKEFNKSTAKSRKR